MALNPRDLPRRYHTIEEYFALERAGDARYEYWDGEIVCVSGGSQAHYRMSGNVHFSLARDLQGGRCQAFTGDAPIRTPTLSPYRYPDASVVCGKAVFEKVEGMDALTNPTLVVEVLSPGTASRDRKEKRAAYQALPSVMEYLLIDQDAPHVTHYQRQAGGWTRADYSDLNAAITLPSVGCVLALSDVYVGVEFE